MSGFKPRDEFDCEGFRCLITRTKKKLPSGIDLTRDQFEYNERGRYWSRLIHDDAQLRIEERRHRDHLERIERHYPHQHQPEDQTHAALR